MMSKYDTKKWVESVADWMADTGRKEFIFRGLPSDLKDFRFFQSARQNGFLEVTRRTYRSDGRKDRVNVWRIKRRE